jgi:hypothetical protein
MRHLALLRGAAVLALALLAGCDAAVTVPETQFEGSARRLAAPAVTVTNSGGYPLLSWSAVAGATSYSVVFQKTRTTIDKATFATESQTWDYPLGSTSGTSFLDTSNAYTGKTSCTSYGTYTTVMLRYRYIVTATSATETASTTVNAPVGPC